MYEVDDQNNLNTIPRIGIFSGMFKLKIDRILIDGSSILRILYLYPPGVSSKSIHPRPVNALTYAAFSDLRLSPL